MTSKQTALACAAALCVLVGGSTARAQSDDGQQQDRWSPSSSNRNEVQQTIRGTIDSVRQADWVGQNGDREQRCIVRLRLENGRTEFVDVGSQSKLRNLDLNQGDQIQLQGQYTTIDGRRVFMANKARVNGQLFTVQRNSGRNQERFSQTQSAAMSNQERTVQGRIQGFRHIYLRPAQGQREQHSLVKLQLQDGRNLVVDLGRKRDLDDLDLQKGDRITLRGRRGMIDGRTVFFADRLRVGDQSLRIARNNSPTRGQSDLSSNSGPSSEQFTLRGKVAGYQVITMQSGQKQVSLLNLALEDGRSVLIDARNKRGELDLKDLDLHDRAVIKGHTKNVEGRQVLVADSVQFEEPSQSQQSGVGRSGQEQRSSGGGSSGSQGESEQNSQSQPR